MASLHSTSLDTELYKSAHINKNASVFLTSLTINSFTSYENISLCASLLTVLVSKFIYNNFNNII